MEIRASRNLNDETFEGCGRWKDDGLQALEVDLRSCRFVDVYGMVALLTIISLHASDGNPVTVQLPKATQAATYLARMGFFDLIPAGVDLDREPPHPIHDPEKLLVELQPINVAEGHHGIDEICNLAWTQLPSDLRGEFVEALSEIGANVIEHSEAEIGFLCAQRFEKNWRKRKGPRVQFVVCDAGIGIRKSLLPAHPRASAMSDKDAIQLALEEGVSGKPTTNSGVGLTTVLRYADIFGGVLRIRSGAGVVIRGAGTAAATRDVPGLPGTVVLVELASPGA